MWTTLVKTEDVSQIQRYIQSWVRSGEPVPFDKAYLCALDLPEEAAVELDNANWAIERMGIDIRIEYRPIYELEDGLLTKLKKEIKAKRNAK